MELNFFFNIIHLLGSLLLYRFLHFLDGIFPFSSVFFNRTSFYIFFYSDVLNFSIETSGRLFCIILCGCECGYTCRCTCTFLGKLKRIKDIGTFSPRVFPSCDSIIPVSPYFLNILNKSSHPLSDM